MNNNTKWIIGLIIAGVIILGGSLIAYGVTKYHKDHPDSSYGSSSTGSSNPGSKTTTQGSGTQQPTPPTCISPSQAANDEGNGQSECVQFTGYAYTSDSGQMYLDQSTSAPYGFSVWIPAGTSGGSSIINQYSGQNIDVTGSIVNYNGEPEIEVTSASQITLAQ